MDLFKKLLFLIKRSPVILIVGKGRFCAAEAVFQVLNHFKKKKNLIFKSDLLDPKDVKTFSFLLGKSRLPILVVTHLGEIPSDKLFFAGDKKETSQIRKLVKILPARGFLILNFDDESAREIKSETRASSLTYGFQKRADLQASDINVNSDGTNFKINYQGNIIPFWLQNLFGKEQIYSALSAISVGVMQDINLVEISQLLGTREK